MRTLLELESDIEIMNDPLEDSGDLSNQTLEDPD
jgi:hypothetical protein